VDCGLEWGELSDLNGAGEKQHCRLIGSAAKRSSGLANGQLVQTLLTARAAEWFPDGWLFHPLAGTELPHLTRARLCIARRAAFELDEAVHLPLQRLD